MARFARRLFGKMAAAMGRALDWLGVAGCRDLAERLLRGVDTSCGGGRIGAHCPFHTESTPGGAFFYRADEDVAHCYSCGTTADLIGVWCAIEGYGLPVDRDGFMAFKSAFAPGAQTPRDLPAPREHSRQFTPREACEPGQAWRERCGDWVEKCAERLQGTPEALEFLAWRGISPRTAALGRLGWNDRDKYPRRDGWGLPEKFRSDGTRAEKFWLPAGLVIPAYRGGHLVKCKVRRPGAAMAASEGALRNLKYVQIQSGVAPVDYSLYGPPDAPVHVLVETELDALLLWQDLRGLRVACWASGGASKTPDTWAAARLSEAQVIINALDTDLAGGLRSQWWRAEFPQSVRWPVPSRYGKDAGAASMPLQLRGQAPGPLAIDRMVWSSWSWAYLDLRAWVNSALPAFARRLIEGRRQPVAQEARPALARHEHRPSEPPREAMALAELLGRTGVRVDLRGNGCALEGADGLLAADLSRISGLVFGDLFGWLDDNFGGSIVSGRELAARLGRRA
jgi:hypothetical protein